ncbi:MAG TPA: arginase family protein [Thermoanaerobaculia bacterium]|jgi:arginase
MPARGDLEIILVPYEVEKGDTAAARAPSALVERGFARRLEEGGATVHTSEVWARHEERAGRAEVVADLGRSLARAVANARSRGRFPLVLSGGCLAAIGVVTGLQRMGRDLGLLWIDAHGDFNTPESTPSGYWDGMALAAVCGRSLPEVYKEVELRPLHYRNVAHLAGRAFDAEEIEDIRRLALTVIPPERLCSDEARGEIARCVSGAREIYLHVDLDGVDPRDAPAVNFPVPGGPSLDDLLACLAGLPAPVAMTLAGLSFERVDADAARRTVDACVRLVQSLAAR